MAGAFHYILRPRPERAQQAAVAIPTMPRSDRDPPRLRCRRQERFESLCKNSASRGAQAEVDLRPKIFQLELSVKNQGRRPVRHIRGRECA